MLQFYLLLTAQMGIFGNYLIRLCILARTLCYHHKVNYQPSLNPRMPSSHTCHLHALMVRPKLISCLPPPPLPPLLFKVRIGP